MCNIFGMLNMTSSGNNLHDNTNENGDLLRQEDTISLGKTINSAELWDLKKQ